MKKVLATTPLLDADKAPSSYTEGGMMQRKKRCLKIPPSSTEEEAKTKFTNALSAGVDSLVLLGHGRDRVSVELLNEIANGFSPNEDEIFQTMERLGMSLEDATKVMTVSTAYRHAQTTTVEGDSSQSSSVGAIDELTSRLNLADLLRGGGMRSRSPSPLPSPVSSPGTASSTATPTSSSNRSRNDSVDPLLPWGAATKKGQRTSTRDRKNNKSSQQQPQGRGRKRALSDQKAEKNRDNNVMIDDQQLSSNNAASSSAATAADLDVKEKIRMNAKPNTKLGRSKSPSESGKKFGSARSGAKRSPSTAALHDEEEEESSKRPRTRSQTEESIILP